jgi:hypothetical protein
MANDNPYSQFVQPSTADENPYAQFVNPPVSEDIEKTILPSLVSGGAALAATPGDLTDLAARGLGWLGTKLPESIGQPLQKGAEATEKFAAPFTYGPMEQRAVNYGTDLGTALGASPEGARAALTYQPQTTAGKYIGSALNFLPSAILPAGDLSLGARAIAAALAGAGSQAGGDVAQHYGLPRWTGQLVGGVAGGLGIPKLVKGAAVAPERAAQAQVLKDAGVPLTAGQETGSPWMLQREANLMTPGRAAQEAGSFTQAVGAQGRMPYPALGTQQFDLGQTAKRAAEDTVKQNEIQPAGFGQLNSDLKQIRRQAYRQLRDKGIGPIDEAIADVQGGPGALSMPGDRYQYLRGNLQHQIENADPATAHWLSQIRKSLDNAMGNEFAPDELSNIHKQTAAYETLRRGAPWKGGQVTPQGLQKQIGPGNLGHPLQPLAEAGQTVLARPATTEPGAAIRNIGGALGYFAGKELPGTPGSDAFVPGIFFREAAPDIMKMATRNPVTRGAYFNPVTRYYLKHGVPGLNKIFTPDVGVRSMARALAGPEAANLQLQYAPGGYPYYQSQ